MRKRHYEWLSLIEFNNGLVEFQKYVNKHPGISVNRAARCFCLKKRYITWCIFDHDFMVRLLKDHIEKVGFDKADEEFHDLIEQYL